MMPPRSTSDRYVFGRFSLAADGSLLEQDGTTVAMAPKVLRLLVVLIERAGEVVRKDEILRSVWPDSFVEETGLTRNVSLLRRALGQEGPVRILTVARVGYRFAGTVQHVSSAAAVPVPQSRYPPTPELHERSRAMVGRACELDALIGAAECARRGRGGLVAVAGETGIGKTTLVNELLREEQGRAIIAVGRCSERLGGAEPHLPVLEALDALIRRDPGFASLLWKTAPTWADYVAPGRLSTPTEPAARPGGGGPERLLRELTNFLETASQHEPVLLFIDDLHWADAATVDVLTHLAPRLPQLRVLIVVTYRHREMRMSGHQFARVRGDLLARGHLIEVAVGLLDRSDVDRYVTSEFAPVSPPSDFAAMVFERSEGNPLFMTELVRFVRQRDRSSPRSTMQEVPDSLRGLLSRMLEELEPTTWEILSIAAVRGPEFDSATVSAVSGLGDVEVEERLRRADAIDGLVRETRRHELPDGTATVLYRFVHILHVEALIDSIPPSRRVVWARQTAIALQRSHQGNTDAIAGSLATLFETAREFWEASTWFLATSRNAVRLFAYAAASELAARGLQCLRSVRAPATRELRQRELDLTFARLVPLASLEGYAQADVEQLTDTVTSLAEDLGDTPAKAAALYATWIVRMVRGECEAARTAGIRMVGLGEAAGDDVLLINGHMQTQIACHHQGDFRRAHAHASAVAAIAGRTSAVTRCIGVLDPVVSSLAESARNNLITGNLAQALADCRTALSTGREIRHPDSLAFAWLFHAWIHGYAQDWTTCLSSADEGIAVAREAGAVQTLAWNECVKGWALGHVGDVDAGEHELTRGIAASRVILGRVALPQFHAMLAEVVLLRDDVPAAEASLGCATELESAHDDHYFSAEVQRLLAVCSRQRGDLSAAQERLRQALEISRAQGASLFELRAALDLAVVDPDMGLSTVRAALAAFPQPEDWPEVLCARRLLSSPV